MQERDGTIRDMVEIKVADDDTPGARIHTCLPASISGDHLKEIVSVIYSTAYTLGMHDANRT
jgi:hypothetical protein